MVMSLMVRFAWGTLVRKRHVYMLENTHRELIAQCLVRLSIALSDCDGPVVVVVVERVVSDILDTAQPATAIQIALEIRLDARPHFDTGAVARIAHGDVENV